MFLLKNTMNKKSLITITGDIGSGKSSTVRELASRLEYETFSAGDTWRALAKEREMNIKEINIQGETDGGSLDEYVDAKQKEALTKEEMIVDGHLAHVWAPESFKIFLSIDTTIAAERILKDKKNNPNRTMEPGESAESIFKHVRERNISNHVRYKKYYGIKYDDFSDYDLVIDTGLKENTLDVVVDRIIEKYNEWKNS